MDCTGTDLSAELAAIGDDLGVLLPDDALVARYSIIKDGIGGRTETWIFDPGVIKVSVEDNRPAQPTSVGQRLENATDSYSIRCLGTVFLNVKDRLTVRGFTYEVQGEMETDSFEIYHTYWSQIVGHP